MERKKAKEVNMKKVAVVTGAAAGIGREIALQLARAGYTVYANGRSEEKLKWTAEAGNGLDIRPLVFDVRDLESVRKSDFRP